MSKYRIWIECMDHDEVFNQKYQDGIECDRFCILAGKDEVMTAALHRVSIDDISEMIKGESKLMQAAILANAKRQIMEMAVRDEIAEKSKALKDLLGLE